MDPETCEHCNRSTLPGHTPRCECFEEERDEVTVAVLEQRARHEEESKLLDSIDGRMDRIAALLDRLERKYNR